MAVGALAAMLPDLDVLLRRADDPLFQLELHRQFSHSLFFVPVGATLVSLVLAWAFQRWLTRREVFVASVAGMLTAGLLDACTSYGTQLLWPLSSARYAWNLTPVVEPFFTLLLLLLCLASLVSQKRHFQFLALASVALFLTHGAIQQSRARKAIQPLLDSRGHQPEELVVKPTLGNQILWRVVYHHQGRLYADAVRTGLLASPKLYPGESLPLVDLRDFRDLMGTRTFTDFERFSQLSQGYLVRHPDQANVLGDGRYAMLPDSVKPLWGLKFDPKGRQAPTFVTSRDSSVQVREKFWTMLWGREVEID